MLDANGCRKRASAFHSRQFASIRVKLFSAFVFIRVHSWFLLAGNVSMTMSPTGQKLRQFASDNYAGICPEAFAAMAEANQGHAVSYGDDSWTTRASDLIR